MHEESISQAEIDALVRGLSGGGGGDPAPTSSSGGAGDDAAVLREALREFASQAGRALTDLVGAPCNGHLADTQETTIDGMKALVSSQLLVGRTPLSGGLSGAVYFVVPMSLGLAMITQIYGGVAPSALDDSAMGALADGLMQMNHAGMQHLTETYLGRPVMAGAMEVVSAGALTEVNGFTPGTPVTAASIDLSVGDDSGRIFLLLTPETAKPLAQAVRARQAGKVPQQPHAPKMTPAVSAPQPVTPPAAVQQQAAAAVAMAPQAYQPAAFPDLAPRGGREEIRNIDLLMDVTLQVTVELGRTRKQIRDVLSLGPGSVLELDKLAGEQVDVLVNGKLIAKGEVVVIDENYGVRITDIISPAERVQSLK